MISPNPTESRKRGRYSQTAGKTRLTLALMLMLGVSGVGLSGCDRQPQPAADSHAGHDHEGHDHDDHEGHDHGPAKKAPNAAEAAEDHAHEGHADEVRLTSQGVKAAGLVIAPAQAQVLRETVVAPARIAFNTEAVAHVGTTVSGRVVQLPVKVGDEVKRGDVLLVLNSPQLGEAQLELFQRRIDEATAKPAVELARSAYERGKKLYDESQGLSLTEVQKREAELRAAEGQLYAAKAQVTAALNRLQLLGMNKEAIEAVIESNTVDADLELRSPLGGRVIERNVALGELVQSDRDALLVVADLSRLWVIADVPESKLPLISVGAPATVMVPALGTGGFQGEVTYISSSVSPATRTVPVRIELMAEGTDLRPGMFAQAQIAASTPGEAVLAIPEAAIQTINGQTSVFVPVEGEANTFARRPVKLGNRVGNMVPVLDGLRENEPVVVRNSFVLKADLGKATAKHEH